MYKISSKIVKFTLLARNKLLTRSAPVSPIRLEESSSILIDYNKIKIELIKILSYLLYYFLMHHKELVRHSLLYDTN